MLKHTREQQEEKKANKCRGPDPQEKQVNSRTEVSE